MKNIALNLIALIFLGGGSLLAITAPFVNITEGDVDVKITRNEDGKVAAAFTLGRHDTSKLDVNPASKRDVELETKEYTIEAEQNSSPYAKASTRMALQTGMAYGVTWFMLDKGNFTILDALKRPRV